MACPSCGGTQAKLIAPGFFECTSTVTVTRPGPGQMAPHLGPMTEVTYLTCGQRYQEGAPAAGAQTCRCGTYAVGRCAQCGTPVCGDHSTLYGGRRLCTASCLGPARELGAQQERARKDAEAAARADAEQAERAEQDRRLAAYVAELTRLGVPRLQLFKADDSGGYVPAGSAWLAVEARWLSSVGDFGNDTYGSEIVYVHPDLRVSAGKIVHERASYRGPFARGGSRTYHVTFNPVPFHDWWLPRDGEFRTSRHSSKEQVLGGLAKLLSTARPR